MAVIIILMIVGFVRARIEKKREDESEISEMKSLTMPSGKIVPTDEELLGMADEDFCTWPKDDLVWLINYIGHKISFVTPEDKVFWNALFERLSKVRAKKNWW